MKTLLIPFLLLSAASLSGCNVEAGSDPESSESSVQNELAAAPSGHRFGPPQAAFDACAGAQENANCSVSFHDHTLSGTCRLGPDASKGLFCAPPHPTPPPEALAACKNLAQGAACSVSFSDHSVDGVCRKPPFADAAICLPKRPAHPPKEAIEACRNASDGAACNVTLRGQTLSGSCHAPPHGGDLACLPDPPLP